MKELTLRYALNPEDAQLNFDMAYEYHAKGHTASAFSHYLRCAERAEDDLLAYEALLRSYFCFAGQGRREFTAVHVLKQAQLILPKRPEAYFLLAKHNSNRTDWAESYVQCSLALTFCEFDGIPLKTFIGYHGKYSLLYEKSKAAWQWDKNSETRDILRLLISDEYWDTITSEEDRNSIINDVQTIGLNSEDQAYVKYDSSKHDKLKFKFKDSKKIESNGSQVFQDMFVLFMNEGKKKGTYLEIGSGPPFHGNNTCLLENNYSWSGLSVELNPIYAKDFHDHRKNRVLLTDALKLDYKKTLKEYFTTNEIDYLQLDLEPAQNTFECLLAIPFEDYKFGVITYEHDYYIDFTKSYREKSRRYLKNLGYELVVADVSPDGRSNFEDWWVHPDLINRDVIDKIKSVDGITNIKTLMLGE